MTQKNDKREKKTQEITTKVKMCPEENGQGTGGQEIAVNRIYKARIFAMIFSEKKALLDLYNAVNKTNYTDPELLVVNTLENAVYMSMQNDVSFIIDSRLSLYEHQSTYCPNLPLRYLMYVSDLYAGITKGKNLYGTKAIPIPPPRFLVFYNGKEKQPEVWAMKLSDLYTIPQELPSLELEAVMLNINPGYNEELLNTCKDLRDYSEYTARVRTYAEEMALEDAVERAITECIQEGILADFLSRNRAEAKRMSIYEYDQELHMQQTWEDGFQDGFNNGFNDGFQDGEKSGEVKGKAIALLEVLEEVGEIPVSLREVIAGQQDLDILKRWLKLAVKVDTVEEFMEKMA